MFDRLYRNRAMFTGNSLSAKKLYFLYDRDNGLYNVITNFKGAMAKKRTTLSTNAINFVPCVLLHRPVLRIRPSIVVHATFSVRNVSRII